MKSRLVCIGTCGACFALLGCASEQQRFTGFLDDYSILEPHPTIQDALVCWNPRIDPKQYKAVLVEPVEVQFMRQGEGSRAKPEDVVAFRKFVTDELTNAISKHAAIVTQPGPNVLRLRLQVANLQFTRSIGKPCYPWSPPDHVLGSANIETEARDSISGELVVAFVGPRGKGIIFTPPVMAAPLDTWEAAKSDLRDRIATWTDHAAQYFVPELNGTQSAMRSPA